MLEELKSTTEARMHKTLHAFQDELKSIRVGRANASLLEHISVEAYGSYMPLNQVASVSILDTKTLSVQVWDQSVVRNAEKAINSANLGVNAFSEGQVIRVPIPPLSTERRQELVKLAGKYAENSRIALRNVRREAMDKLKNVEHVSKDDLRKVQDSIQHITDKHIQEVDSLLAAKEKDILHV
jgi:ribosome recycling factor